LHYSVALSIVSWILLGKSLLVVVSIFMSHELWKCHSIVSWILLEKLLSVVEFWIFDCLTSQVKNLNSDLTRDQYQVESQDWYQVFKSSHDIDIKYSSESESRYENLTWWSV